MTTSLAYGGVNRKVLAAIAISVGVLLVALIGIRYAAAVAPSDYGLKEGDTISAAGSDDPDVYIVNEWGYKRLFLNPVIFGFYGHLGGFAKVKNVTPAVRDAFPTSGLFRNCETNDPKVYGVEVTGEDTGVLHWVNVSGAQAVADDPNFFKKVFCINNNEFNWYAKGSDYTSVSQVPSYARTSTTPTPSAGLSVSLASDNPASGTLVAGSSDATSQAAADLAHFTFTGSGTVTNLKLKRLGVSADTTLDNVYLYLGNKRLTDAASVTNGEISFNDAGGLFTVNGSATIAVKADINNSTNGQTVGVQLISYNGNSVSISGNLHTIASATLATVTFGSSTTPSANSALDPADDVIGWQNTVTVGTRYVWLKSLQLRVVGSVVSGDLQNFRLFVDGVQKASVDKPDSNGYVVFDMTGNPVKLETGGRVLKVLVNVVGGSTRNFTLSLRQAPDIRVTDSEYGADVRAAAASGSSFPISAGQQTISSGTLTITKKTDSPSGDVVKDASGVTLARFEFKANGEKMKVENLRISNSSNPQVALRNGALFADDGMGGPMIQIGSTQTIWEDSSPAASNSTAYTEYSLGSSLIVEPGKPRTVEIRADIYDASGTNDIAAGGTITANIEAGSSNVQRLTSLGYASYPASTVSGNQLTVRTGSLSAAKYSGYANQSVVVPRTGIKLGHFTLTAASSEDVNINTIDIGFNDVTGQPASKTTDVYIKVVRDDGTLLYTSPAKATVSAAASSSYSVNFTLPQNRTYQVEVWGNLDTMNTGRVLQLEFSASGVTANSSTSTTSSVVLGQTITTTTGSLTKATGSIPAATLAAGGQIKPAYAFTLTPEYDNFTLDEVYVDLSSTLASSTGAVAYLTLKENGVPVGQQATVNPTTASASFTGLNRELDQTGGTKTYTVEVQLANVGVGANDTGGNVTVRLDGMKYRDGRGTITTVTGLTPSSYTGNAIIVHKAYPTFTAVSNGVLTNGTASLFKATVGSSGASSGIVVKKVVFTITTTANPTIDENTYKVYLDGGEIAGSIATASHDFTSAGAGTGTVSFVATTPFTISGSSTLELRATVGGANVAGDSITTKIANPSSSAITDDYTTVAATSASFVWSDSSAPSHSTSTDDWMNDYLIQTANVSYTLAK